MSWKKYFTQTNTSGQMSPLGNTNSYDGTGTKNYSSYLPEVYVGHPNRIQRYYQYDQMDQDSEVNAALDIIAEFCTQSNKQNGTPFKLTFKDSPSETEARILKQSIQQFVKLQDMDKRIFRTFRNVLKYGDAFFIRDPETLEMYHVDSSKVDKIIVNESEGKKPEQYVVKDLNINTEKLTATTIPANVTYASPGVGGAGNSGYGTQAGNMGTNAYGSGGSGGRFQQTQHETAIDANHIVHLSLSEGMDTNYPFGNSILETIFKVFKQKELLEDAIIIYRVHRAPERRVFYIDVGNMPTHLAMGFVERVKNEIHQRRIPSVSGGSNQMDAGYNPLSINEDYFFPQTAEGRGSKVETLPGGTNLGEIDDLRYFTNKLVRGLRIPSSYLPTGPDDGQQQYSDGRVGTAYIQELRFNKYCERLQSLIAPNFDLEFKYFLKTRGINIDSQLFDVEFNEPQNFASYRQMEMDGTRVNTYAAVAENPYLSKRFAMKRFLGLAEEEIAENEHLWHEENGTPDTRGGKGSDMRGVGVSPGTLGKDIASAEDPTPEPGAEVQGEGPEDATEPGDTGEPADL